MKKTLIGLCLCTSVFAESTIAPEASMMSKSTFYKNELSKYCQEVVQINAVSTLLSLHKIRNYLKKFNKNRVFLKNTSYCLFLFQKNLRLLLL